MSVRQASLLSSPCYSPLLFLEIAYNPRSALSSIYSMRYLLKSHLSIRVCEASQSNMTWAYPQTEDITLKIITTAKFQRIFTGVPLTSKQKTLFYGGKRKSPDYIVKPYKTV